MSHAYDERGLNVLGALGVALGDRLARAGAAGSAAEALVVLEAEPGLGIDALARSAGLSHSGGVRLVDRLVAAGHVERRRGDDARTAVLVLTPDGRRTARRVLARRAVELRGVLDLLDEADQVALTGVVERLVERMAAEGADAGRMCRLCDREACGRGEGRCPVERGAGPSTR